jgi:hypothetical protein
VCRLGCGYSFIISLYSQTLFSISGKAFACVFEERELDVQLVLDEDSLATINFAPPKPDGIFGKDSVPRWRNGQP